MQLKRRDVLTGLRKLGEIFQGRKHEKCRVVIDGKEVATFAIPSSRDFDDTLIAFVAKPLGLQNHPFGKVCDCTHDATWFREYLVARDLL